MDLERVIEQLSDEVTEPLILTDLTDVDDDRQVVIIPFYAGQIARFQKPKKQIDDKPPQVFPWLRHQVW